MWGSGNQSIRKRFPLLNSLGRITTPFGGNTKYEDFHPGVDIANEKGTPVPSIDSGVVEQVRTGASNGEEQGFGNAVQVRTPENELHQFGHLDNVLVRPGQKVKPGTPVGTMGNSGASYSPSGSGDGTHLDLRVIDRFNRFKNPLED